MRKGGGEGSGLAGRGGAATDLFQITYWERTAFASAQALKQTLQTHSSEGRIRVQMTDSVILGCLCAAKEAVVDSDSCTEIDKTIHCFLAAAHSQDVLRFDISKDETCCMDRPQSCSYLTAYLSDFMGAERTL